MNQTLDIPQRHKRHFLSESFVIDKWENILPLFENLKNREINNSLELRQWFKDRSELESAISEDMGWRYIRMTGDTSNQEYVDHFNYFISEIQPHIEPLSNDLNEKVLKSPFLKEIKDKGYDILIRTLKKDHEIFREKNIPLNTEINQEAQRFGSIAGSMTVVIDEKELTLQQASDLLKSTDRVIRENVYYKIAERRFSDKDKLNELFNKLLSLRHHVAVNAGFSNFRDYMFTAMGRFDYSPEDCFSFHKAISKEVVPVLNTLAKKRKEALKVESLRPWDLSVNYSGKNPLKPFNDSQELIDKSIECFSRLNPYLGERLAIMKEMRHLDLESRKGKAPGGYNYPLDEIGVPFIFMNATSSLNDLVTMVHEGGHAIHSFVTRELEINSFKNTPSEVAELASMSMELISMEHWGIFFQDQNDLNRAKREHLEGIISTLPWVAIIDKFQHWIYENPNHTIEDRTAEWNRIFNMFSDTVTDWNGLQKFKDYIWQKQLHIFEVPFYYIEYAIAQLGAIAIWKNYKSNPSKALDQYLAALKLGYTKPITEIYEAAGIKFDFSQPYINELISFVKDEMDKFK